MGFIAGLTWFILCIVVGVSASNRGRFGFGYFLLSLFLSPLAGIIIILLLGENKNMRKDRLEEEAEIRESVALRYKDDNYTKTVFKNVTNDLLDYSQTKKCPFCAEEIKFEAILCRFCGKDIVNENPLS